MIFGKALFTKDLETKFSPIESPLIYAPIAQRAPRFGHEQYHTIDFLKYRFIPTLRVNGNMGIHQESHQP